jgi:protein SCO1
MRGTSRAAVMAAAMSSVCAVALLPMIVGPAHAHGPAPATRNVEDPAGHRRWGANYFPNVELTTQDGKSVRFYDDLLKGKQVAINLIFTTCKDVCPLETANLVQLKRVLGERVGKDIFMYSISIDPERDTPEVLKAYAEKFGAGGPDWLFLTGKPEDIKLIGKKLGMIRDRDNPRSRDSHHAAYLMIGDEPNGQWTRNSVVDNPRFLAARIGTFLGWREIGVQQSYANARPVTVPNGQRLFVSKCSACHTLGQGDKVGPDLAGVTDRRDHAWLTRYVSAPDEVLGAGDPIATALFNKYKKIGMPNLGLGSSDVADLISYMASQNKAHGEKAQPTRVKGGAQR